MLRVLCLLVAFLLVIPLAILYWIWELLIPVVAFLVAGAYALWTTLEDRWRYRNVKSIEEALKELERGRREQEASTEGRVRRGWVSDV